MLRVAFGSVLADLLGGYALFAPFTLVIKGVEGLVVGLLTRPGFRMQVPLSRADVASAMLAICAGGALMVTGYFIAEAYVLRLGIGAAATEVPGNVFQVVGGLILAMPVSLALRRVRREGE